MPSRNLEKLSCNPYPGRGLILGTDETGKYAVQVYWIMGRSDNSRNRIFNSVGDRLFTEAADPAKVEDPSLIIYNAMDCVRKEWGGCFAVSNGSQTDAVVMAFTDDWVPLGDALSEIEYEPDAPNFTPRITGVSLIIDGRHFIELALLRKSAFASGDEDDCLRFYFEYNSIRNGVGFCLTTYTGDGKPLPSFVGEPLAMPLLGDQEHILNTYWDALNPDNRVSLAVKFIHLETLESRILIKNRFTKVG